ncbi:MAG TPA: hypothetical protein PKA53_00710 [Sphingobacterium sp.]|nr:hypothetical protein [Sphingobacterium sp.]
MIRPLEYCGTSEHVRTSLNTIDERIREMLVLRQQYLEKLMSVEQDDSLLNVIEENNGFTEKIIYHIAKKS